ncbi:MAG: hypothetical protein M1495_03710, partial [Bacteroidetes bacterium]|nr:hypothetical protein [Bacteroidota bacterium]
LSFPFYFFSVSSDIIFYIALSEREKKCLAGLYLLGFYLLEVKHSMGYKEIVVTLLLVRKAN